MTNFKSTKRALLSSVVALMLCFAMLLGSTFAWFTDSATSGNNLIKTGNLAVELWQYTESNPTGTNVSGDAPVFNDAFLWEPNATQVVYLAVKNTGSLALKYNVVLNVAAEGEKNLTDVMSFKVINPAAYGSVTSWDDNGATKLEVGKNTTALTDVALYPVATATGTQATETVFALAIHMDETAGNDYQNKEIKFDIKVVAGQLSAESDSFGPEYDAYAAYPGTGTAPNPTYNNPTNTQSAVEVGIVNKDNFQVGSIVAPADALDPNVPEVKASIDDTPYKANVTVNTGYTTAAYDISVEGLKAGNTTPVKVNLTIAPGLDPDTVTLYHYDTEIPCTYDPNTGYVFFQTTGFSPFTVVFDPNSEYDAPEVDVDDAVANKNYPTANVIYDNQYVNTELAWGSYGQWSPTAGLDSNLEAAFVFTCPDYENATAEEKAVIDAYRYWYCDFYVSLDRDLGENQIFLGGNYGDFGWVGFHNGDVTLKANEELGLLESVTSNPWTYNDVETFVGEFICGVGDVNNALEGATFTVKLRLTNPADSSEFIDVNVVTYTFGAGYTIK